MISVGGCLRRWFPSRCGHTLPLPTLDVFVATRVGTNASGLLRTDFQRLAAHTTAAHRPYATFKHTAAFPDQHVVFQLPGSLVLRL